MADFLVPIGIVTAAFIAFVAFVTGLSYVTSSWQCSSRWAGTYPTKYELVAGCRVQINGKWVPEDRVREF